MIKRVVVALVAVVCLGALAYAQVAREGSLSSDDAVNVGGTYLASFCADRTTMPGASANNFYMHVTAKFMRGWLEADVSAFLVANTDTLQAPTRLRLNDAKLCYVQVVPKPAK